MSLVHRYGKALVPAGIAIITAAQAPLTDGRITMQEVITFLIAVNATVGVYFAPVLHYRYAKTIVGVANAVLIALTTVIVGGINAHDITELALAALLAIGVTAANADSTPVIAGETVSGPHEEAIGDAQ